MTTTVIVTVPDVLDPVVIQIEFAANTVPVHDIGTCDDDEPSALFDGRPDSGTDDDPFDVDPVADPW
jgi:hypothetical protein